MTALISVKINDQILVINSGMSVAAALALSGNPVTRTSLTDQARAPVCGMGVCMECRVNIDGRAHQLACQIMCLDGMQITTAKRH